MTVTRPRAERGAFPPGTEHYGRSLLGAPLIWFPALAADRESGLILAGTHGDENSSVVTLSCALRTLNPSLRRHHVVLAVNPDGCQLGLRANANGIDLNRNFPAANWKAGETVYRWNSSAEERDVVLLTGESPGSEPETQALCQLIHRIHPAWVVSFHDPLACIEDPRSSELGAWLAQSFELPLVTSVGYETPGSFGSWCADLNLHCITAEFPPISSDEASEKYLLAMSNLLRWHPRDGAARS
ncbi:MULTISPECIES: murein tripeptide amidase MpaA [Citrobacter]|uniref:murein tripeptide amidase MpaA n=1 Tax=Citrobacter TaxID=544 RepID=UPI00044BB095|nr:MULTISPECIES: murein tripeptide amidase MpaA [Citrobacter]ATX95278.1 murein peptide amidase A [Citrobacter freundii]AUU26129.1 murein peptide amidase A [Citrobacter freundii]AYL42359.1 murein peptide amidase A [Citrobacter freundii]EGT0625202.1 murein tripeptide amidase MpaA [Citrobacter freundii]EKT8563268.1 murein tripeptide amidase MpaA [Citrobacter freundii]